MLTSKQLLEKSGISRATLNNYIALGLLPRPRVRQPEPGSGRARRLGHFPDAALDTLGEIDRLKRTGLRMAEIARRLGGGAPAATEAATVALAGPPAGALKALLGSGNPARTHIAVLAAHLEDGERIRAELPPDEYFELVGRIRSGLAALFEGAGALPGSRWEAGPVHFFLPGPPVPNGADHPGGHLTRALRCALAIKAEMATVDGEWRSRKGWTNRLTMNMGLDEGLEWVGIHEGGAGPDITVLGDIVNRAARLADFATGGSVWASKNLMEGLSGKALEAVKFGVRRNGADGSRTLIEATFAKVGDLAPLEDPDYRLVRPISDLAVTEILAAEI